MKDKSCEQHRDENKICYIEIKDEGYIHSQRLEVEVVADYNGDGELVGLEFPGGIPKKEYDKND